MVCPDTRPDIFAMDSKELSSISDCFGDKKAIKTPKLNTIWLELIARVLNMLIRLKGDNYYSKVFKRVNYKLSNSTFWVVISAPKVSNNCYPLEFFMLDSLFAFPPCIHDLLLAKDYKASKLRFFMLMSFQLLCDATHGSLALKAYQQNLYLKYYY